MSDLTTTTIYDTLDKNLYKKGVSSVQFSPETSDFRGDVNVLSDTIVNRLIQQKSRTYDAIVDADGGADYLTLEDAIKYTESLSGGSIFLLNGTYKPAATMAITYPTLLEGENSDLTVIDFNSTASKFTATGTDVYSTGTITSITGGVAVVGSGTSWAANVTANESYLWLNGVWHIVVVVTDDTHLTLGEGYAGPTISSNTYLIAKPIKQLTFRNLTIKNSTGSMLDFDYVRYTTLDNLLITGGNINLDVNYFGELKMSRIVSVSATSDNNKFTNGGRLDVDGSPSISAGQHCWYFENVWSSGAQTSVGDQATSDGWHFKDCNDMGFERIQAKGCGGQGVEAESGNDGLTFVAPIVEDCTGAGFKFTATSDNCEVIGGSIKNNLANKDIWIANANCDNTYILAAITTNNTNTDITNSGTGTRIIRESDVGRVDSLTTTVNHSGDTNETTLVSLTVPAGIMGINGVVKITVAWRGQNAGGGAGSQILRIKFGATTYVSNSRSSTSGSSEQITELEISNRNSDSSQIGFWKWFKNDGATSGVQHNTNTTSSIDTSAAVTVLVTGELSNAAHDIDIDTVYIDVSPEA